MPSFIGPNVKKHFDTLSDALKKEILSRNVTINDLNDLIKCLEDITSEY